MKRTIIPKEKNGRRSFEQKKTHEKAYDAEKINRLPERSAEPRMEDGYNPKQKQMSHLSGRTSTG